MARGTQQDLQYFNYLQGLLQYLQYIHHVQYLLQDLQYFKYLQCQSLLRVTLQRLTQSMFQRLLQNQYVLQNQYILQRRCKYFRVWMECWRGRHF